jgi:PAS domain S-box-containing protein
MAHNRRSAVGSSLEDIDVTPELASRPSRPPDHEAESRALVALARRMAESPRDIMQELAETALALCQADSAGISILEDDGGRPLFRWHATAGDFVRYLGGTTPRDFSPCGVVLDREAPQLMADPVRYYPYIEELSPHIAEVLLLPFYRGDVAIGTLWVVAHHGEKRFDAEDVRVMTSLAEFASAAVQTLSTLDAIEASDRDLRDARSRLDSALAAGAIATWTWDIVNDRVIADANLARTFSVSPEDAAGGSVQNYLRSIHPDDRERVAASIERSVEALADFRAEFRVVQGGGQIRWVDARGQVQRDPAGKAISLPGVIVDVTERRQAEDRLRESEEFNRSIVESSSDCVKVLDLEGRLLAMNSNGCRLMEIDDFSRCIDQPWRDYWPAEGSVLADSALEAARRGNPASFQGYCPTAKGTGKWWDVAVTPILNAGGEPERILAVSRDITASKQTEALLKSQAEALAEADRRKDEFLAMLAHELRNPLAAIGNAVRLMTMTDVKETLEYSTDSIRRQTGHLSRLIEDLLDVSRMSLGKIELRREILDATPVLDSAAESVKTLVDERKHTLTVAAGRGNLWVDADPTRLEQVVINLLNNAAKYSENGGHISLSAGHEDGEVVIRVKDAGIGIPPEKLPEMFELFAQGNSSSTRSEGGLGIGLTVVKKLVEMQGGSITAHSEGLGKGSEFVIRLPAAERPATSMPPAEGPDEAMSNARILVVDDNVDTARGMARLLKLTGHDVATAHSGPEAIEAARAHRPDVILLDIGLPGMDGYEVAKRLRQEPGCKDAVIIAASGYGQEADRHRTEAAGFDHHLVKPIDFDALRSLLRGRAGG